MVRESDGRGYRRSAGRGDWGGGAPRRNVAQNFQIIGPDVGHACARVDVQQQAADVGLAAIDIPARLASQDADLASQHPRDVDDLQLLPAARVAVDGAGDRGDQRLSAAGVERPRQGDLSEELHTRPIGVDPDHGPQVVDDPRTSDVVCHQHAATALTDHLNPLATLSTVRPAANPLVGHDRVLGITAGVGPRGGGSLEILPPRRLRSPPVDAGRELTCGTQIRGGRRCRCELRRRRSLGDRETRQHYRQNQDN